MSIQTPISDSGSSGSSGDESLLDLLMTHEMDYLSNFAVEDQAVCARSPTIGSISCARC